MKYSKLILPSLITLMIFSGESFAEDASGTFLTSAQIVQTCVLSVPSALALGNYDGTNANATTNLLGETQINVKCAAGTPATTVYIGKGTTVNTTYNKCSSPIRQLFLNGDTSKDAATYYLYKESDLTTNWGCQTGQGDLGGKSVGPFVNSTEPVVTTVYAKVASAQNTLTVGHYTDVLSVWIAF